MAVFKLHVMVVGLKSRDIGINLLSEGKHSLIRDRRGANNLNKKKNKNEREKQGSKKI